MKTLFSQLFTLGGCLLQLTLKRSKSSITKYANIWNHINIQIYIYAYIYIYIYIWRRADCLRKCTKIKKPQKNTKIAKYELCNLYILQNKHLIIFCFSKLYIFSSKHGAKSPSSTSASTANADSQETSSKRKTMVPRAKRYVKPNPYWPRLVDTSLATPRTQTTQIIKGR